MEVGAKDSVQEKGTQRWKEKGLHRETLMQNWIWTFEDPRTDPDSFLS